MTAHPWASSAAFPSPGLLAFAVPDAASVVAAQAMCTHLGVAYSDVTKYETEAALQATVPSTSGVWAGVSFAGLGTASRSFTIHVPDDDAVAVGLAATGRVESVSTPEERAVTAGTCRT